MLYQRKTYRVRARQWDGKTKSLPALDQWIGPITSPPLGLNAQDWIVFRDGESRPIVMSDREFRENFEVVPDGLTP